MGGGFLCYGTDISYGNENILFFNDNKENKKRDKKVMLTLNQTYPKSRWVTDGSYSIFWISLFNICKVI